MFAKIGSYLVVFLHILCISSVLAIAQPSVGTTTFDGLISNTTNFDTGTGSAIASDVLSTGWNITIDNLDGTSTAVVQGINDQGDDAATIDDDFIQLSPGRGLNTEFVSFASSDGSEFQLETFKLYYSSSGSAEVTIKGFRDGSEIVSASKGVLTNNTWNTIDVSSNTGFDNVDEIRVTYGSPNAATTRLDDIFIAAAVASNAAPSFNSSATASIDENTPTSTVVLDVNADDGNGGGNDANITYSLTGDDADDFNIDTNSGEISFKNSPDYENPADANSDNNYQLTVTADDGERSNNTATQDITITVNDVSEGGGCSITNNGTGNQTSGSFGQSFLAPCDGVLNSIGFFVRTVTAGHTLTVYEGEGTSGKNLGSVDFDFSSTSTNLTSDYKSIDLSSENISLTKDQVYTINTSGNQNLYYNNGDNYSGGKLYFNGGAQNSLDLMFNVEIGPAASNTTPNASDFSTTTGPYQNIAYTFSTSDFGYTDDDSDPLDHLRVTATTGNGTLYVDTNNNDTYDTGTDTQISNGDQIAKADLDAGNLQYITTGTSDDSFSFDVNDGTDYSSSTYTATLDVIGEPTVSLSLDETSISETGGSATLTATLSHVFPKTVEIVLSFSGTATGLSDYNLTGTQINISSGTTGTLAIPAIGDDVLEGDETAIFGITSVKNGSESGTQEVTLTITDDDDATVTIADASGNEDDGSITLTATLDNAVKGGFSVDVSTGGGTATAGIDYTPVTSETLTFTGTAGETKTFTVTPTSDSDVESDETINISMDNFSGTIPGIDISDEATVTITNDDVAVSSPVAINVEPDSSSTEIAVDSVLYVTFDQPVSLDDFFGITISDGTDNIRIGEPTLANPESTKVRIPHLDFNYSTSYTVTFAPGTVSNSDDVDNESFSWTFTTEGLPNSAPVITANQTFSVHEDAANATVLGTVAATDADNNPLSNWTITGGNTDGIFSINSDNGQLTIADNSNLDYETTTSYTLTLTVSDGTDISSQQTITVNVNEVDDVAPTIVSSSPADDATDVSTSGVLSISFSEDITDGSGSITIYDVTGSSNFHVFDVNGDSEGGESNPKAGTYGIIGNTLYLSPPNALQEGNEYAIQIGASAIEDQAGNTFEGISDNTTLNFTTFVNAGFTVTESSGSTSTAESGSTDTFTVVLDTEPSSNVAIDVTSGDTGEGTVDVSSLTFTPANWDTPQTVTVTGVDDEIIDGTQSYNITLSVNDAASDDDFDLLSDKTLSVSNSDDDVAGFTVTETDGGTEVSETGTTDSFTVVLDAKPASAVFVTISSDDTGEATVSDNSLVFNPDTWDTPQTVTVTGVDDDLVDGSQITTITLSINDGTSDDDFDSVSDQTVTVTTTDEDVPLSVPTLTTSTPIRVTSSSATWGGDITDDGNATITERGVVYSYIDEDPEIGEDGVVKAQMGIGDGSFTDDVTGLYGTVKYFVRAYATNSEGTSYGSVETYQYNRTPIWGHGSRYDYGTSLGEFQDDIVSATADNLNDQFWNAVSVSEDDGNTSPGSAYWIRNNTGVSQGASWGSREPLPSPTQLNGVAIFDSEYLDNNGGGTSPSPHHGELISPTIDLTGYTDTLMAVSFFTHYRSLDSKVYVSFSNDNGATWTKKEFKPELSNGDEYVGDALVLFPEVTMGIVNMSQIRLRFSFEGESYFWMVDDVAIITKPRVSNYPPTATNVAFSGTLEVGEELTGTYDYSDTENNPESGSSYQWYRSDDAQGTGKKDIDGATNKSYTLASADEAKYISFEVTPNDGTDAGNAVESPLQGPIELPDTTPPHITSVNLEGNPANNAQEITYRVRFSEPVDSVNMEDFEIDLISGFAEGLITQVEYDTDSSQVLVRATIFGNLYGSHESVLKLSLNETLSNIQDLAGNALEPYNESGIPEFTTNLTEEQTSGKLNLIWEGEDIPASSPFQLNTQSLGVLIPQIPQIYPNSNPVKLELSIDSLGINHTFYDGNENLVWKDSDFTLKLLVLPTGEEEFRQVALFEGVLTMVGSFNVVDGLEELSYSMSSLNIGSITAVSSELGNINTILLSFKLNLASAGIVAAINEGAWSRLRYPLPPLMVNEIGFSEESPDSISYIELYDGGIGNITIGGGTLGQAKQKGGIYLNLGVIDPTSYPNKFQDIYFNMGDNTYPDNTITTDSEGYFTIDGKDLEYKLVYRGIDDPDTTNINSYEVNFSFANNNLRANFPSYRISGLSLGEGELSLQRYPYFDRDRTDGSEFMYGMPTPGKANTIFLSNETISIVENNSLAGNVDAFGGDVDNIENGVSYSISGGVDQDKFTVNSTTGELSFKSAPDYENPGDGNSDNTYELEVTANRSAPLNDSDSRVFQVKVTDVDEVPPSVTINSQTTSPTNTGSVPLNITFSEEVNGFSANDITVSNGSVSNVATSDSTSFTADLSPTTDGIVTVDIPASVAMDNAGNNNTAATQYSITYDATAPTVSISTSETDPTNGAFTATFTFSEDVTGFVSDDITAGNASLSNFSATSAKVYSATVTPTADGTVTLDVAASVAMDAAGNDNTAASQFSIGYDATAPTVSISSDESDPTNSAITILVSFSEDVTGFTINDITAGNASVSNFSASSASEYSATITPTHDGIVTVDVAGSVATDAAGNNNLAATQFTRTFDATSPALTISTQVQNPTNTNPIPITFTFKEEVNGFAASDVTIQNGSLSNLSTNDSTSFTANFTPTADGVITVDVAGSVATDNAGNDNKAAEQFSIIYDATPPSVTITSEETGPTNANPLALKVSFSEDVNGFSDSDITVGNGSISKVETADSTTFSVALIPNADGTMTVDVAAGVVTDQVGNQNTAASQFSITYDGTPPTVAITSDELDPTNNTFPVTFTFSEDVTGFSSEDITTGNASVSNFTSTSATVYTASITPTTDGTVTVDVASSVATDKAGNQNSAASQFSITYDGTPPEAPVVAAIEDDTGKLMTDQITNDQSLKITGTAEALSTVEVLLDGNRLGITTADGAGDWSFDHTGTDLAEGIYEITANATDAAGNTSAISTALVVDVDLTAPETPILAGIETDSGNSINDQITRNQNIVINGTAEANSTIELFIDGESVGNTTTDGAGEWSLDNTSNSLAEGVYELTAQATDMAGNTSAASYALSVEVDITAPEAATFTGITTDSGSSSSDGITNDQTIAVTGLAEMSASVELFMDGNSIGKTNSDESGNWTFDYTGTSLPEGTHSIAALVTDLAGNISPAESLEVQIDITSPENPVVTQPSEDILVEVTDYTISGTHAENGVSVLLFADDDANGTADNSTPLDSAIIQSGAWSFQVELQENMVNNFVVQAVDLAGNTSSQMDVPAITVDNQPPVITSNPDGAIFAEENQRTAFTVTASDLNSISYSLNGGVDQSLFTIDENSGVLLFTEAPDAENPDDQNSDNRYEVSVIVSDGLRSTSQSFVITVTDVNEFSPTLSFPTPLTLSEMPATGDTLGRAIADDEDIQASLEFSLQDNFDADEDGEPGLAIDATSGFVTVSDADDFDPELVNSITFTVQVSDGENEASQSVTIEIISALSVIATTPSDTARKVALDAEVEIQFNENITEVDFSGIRIEDEAGSAVEQVNASISGENLLLSHALFSNETSYTVIIPAGAVQNSDEQPNGAFSFSFTTIMAPPVVEVSNPVDEATGIALDQSIELRFSQDINVDAQDAFSIVDSTEQEVEITSFTAADSLLQITHAGFDNAMVYTLSMEEGAIVNADSISNAPFTLSFTSIKTVPVIIQQTPLADAEDVDVETPIEVQFDQPVSAGDLSGVQLTSNGVAIESVDVQVIDSSLVIIPEELEYLTMYTVVIPFGAVRNSDDLVNDEFSWSFTTIVQMPGEVTLASPADSLGSVFTGSSFSWNAAERANSYEIQIASDENFESITAEAIGVDELSFSPEEPLLLFTPYWWRVRGINENSEGPWSEAFTFATEAEIPSISFPANEATDISTAPLLRWTNIPEGATFEIQLAANDQLEPMLIDTTLTVDELQLEGLSAETNYFWQVRVADTLAGIPTGSEWTSMFSFTTRPDPIVTESDPVDVLIEFGTTSGTSEEPNEEAVTPQQTDYRMVGLPGSDRIRVDDFFTGPYRESWRAFIETGDDLEFYDEYTPDDDRFVFSPGLGFWVLSTEIVTGNRMFTAVQTNENDSYPISVHSGWNIISNPYQSAVEWSLVEEFNNFSGSIYGYEQQFGLADTLKPFKGYYFYNDPNLNRETLFIPYTGFEQRGTEQTKLSDKSLDGKAHLNIEIFYPDSSRTAVQLVEEPKQVEKEKGRRFNREHPDLRFAKSGMVITDHKENHMRYNRLMSTKNTDEPYFVEVRARVGSSTVWRPEAIDLPGTTSVLLLNVATNKSYLIPAFSEEKIKMTEPISRYEVYVGNQMELEELQQSMLPTEFTLAQNYPNPFNPTTNIRYSVPELTDVRLEIYDLLGRKVQTLVNSKQSAGWYVYDWNASHLASGIYFYRLQAGKHVQTKKLTLIK
ncbi:Por secretion system C-terminal sorting domain-containing protein [Gracilimonas mengyeensis]|uniref:Por secretion system C-terminal sorting domain-containing protein n=1 Tax=Gracilimonas mengyeensis TaxID=1302730 RepID=A0A521AU51_9BACT|nr:Por secretion system C-terminal sorting domain-containing protein [Gracilimonas mengyeensis]